MTLSSVLRNQAATTYALGELGKTGPPVPTGMQSSRRLLLRWFQAANLPGKLAVSRGVEPMTQPFHFEEFNSSNNNHMCKDSILSEDSY